MYELRRKQQSRRMTRYIIISQIRNFEEKLIPAEPRTKIGSSSFTHQNWEEYFYKKVGPAYRSKGTEYGIPYHYYIEQIRNEYNILIGDPDYTYSEFLMELAKYDIIHRQYTNSILIAVGEDFSLESSNIKRLWEMLSFKLLAPLIIRFHTELDRTKVLYIDEIIDWEKYEEKKDEIPYLLKKAIYFNFNDVDVHLKRYSSSIRTI